MRVASENRRFKTVLIERDLRPDSGMSYFLPRITGHPAISVPCGLNSEGLPIGLQVAGRAFDEETVLRVAHAYESLAPPPLL